MFDPNKTIRNQLPYHFEPTIVGDKIKIVNTRGQTLIVSRDEITRQLNRDDLDTHRRRMYEAARDALRKTNRL